MEKSKTTRETAQQMTLESVIEYVTFSKEFYCKEIGKEMIKNNPSQHMIEHCEEMYSANTQLLEYLKHFKFI